MEGQIVLITGAAGGIGKKTCKLFQSKNANMILTDINAEALEDVKNCLKPILHENQQLHCFAADLCTHEGCKELLNFCVQKFDDAKIDAKFDAIVMCHGGFSQKTLLMNLENEVQMNFTVNAMSFIQVMHTFCEKNDVVKNGGSIVGITSMVAQQPAPGMLGYSVAKAAAQMAFKCYALRLSKKNIRVNAVMPSVVDTPLMKRFATSKGIPEDAFMHNVGSANPANRNATPNDIAHMLFFLSTKEADFVRGACVPVDGGALLTNWMVPK